VLFAVLVVACNKDTPDTSSGSASGNDSVQGAFTVDGQPQTLLACNTGHAVHVFVEVLTTSGRLHFEDQALYWTADTASTERGAKLACEKLDRSWGGGNRMDGTSYFRGTLAFRCTNGKTPLAGDLTIDCGHITAGERAELDKNRKAQLEHQ
jgi:hypothetical protein